MYAMIDSVSDDSPKVIYQGEGRIRVTCGIYVSLILSEVESVELIEGLSDALHELKSNHALSQENSHDSYDSTIAGRTPTSGAGTSTPTS